MTITRARAKWSNLLD